MTIIDEEPQDARAKRRINPLFRLDGGPLPRENPEAFPITLKNKKDQSNTWESRQQRSTPLQAALAFFSRKQRPRAFLKCGTMWDTLYDTVRQHHKSRFSAVFAWDVVPHFFYYTVASP